MKCPGMSIREEHEVMARGQLEILEPVEIKPWREQIWD